MLDDYSITQYNSTNSPTPEFKSASFEKRNNLEELINIPTKAEERSMIHILLYETVYFIFCLFFWPKSHHPHL